ncbi:MAG TPA: potassium transporter TrkG [Thermomicrobiales bacterium]|nr:potassium transporter TrkG [Thermomicrobiales bacterium]
MDQQGRKRLPGNRVVRRRIDATQIIDIPDHGPRVEVPSVQVHAKRFVLALLALIATSTVLLSLPWATESGKATPPVDAFFTAVSATSVTGLAVVDTQHHWSFLGELLILIQIQVGGLGFMVGASVVLASLGRALTLRDSLMLQDGSPTLSLFEATQLSKRILRFIFIAEGAGFIFFTAHFLRSEPIHVAVWHGLFTSVSAFCNAGFDLQGEFTSLSGFADSILVNGTAFVLIQAGALSFITFSDAWSKKRWGRFALDTKLVLLTNLILLAGGMAMFLILEWGNAMAGMHNWAKPMAAFFQSASVRTAGFSTFDFSEAHPATVFLSIAIMMVGGAAGSTTGGVKLATIAVLAIAVLSTVRGQADAQAFGRRVSSRIVFRAMAVTALFLFAHFVLTLSLAVSEDVIADNGFGFLPLMLEGMSAIATAGLSTGITPDVSAAGKLLLCVGMFVGRLGPLTAVYALQRRQQATRYRFPEAPIRIG